MATAEAKTNPFEMAQEQIDQCAKILKLDPQITELLQSIPEEQRGWVGD